MNSIARFLFCKIWGWKIEGTPINVPKFVVIVVPHTSNWDFIVGLLLRPASNLNHCVYIGKSSLFVFPLGYLFRALGGMPVERTKSNNFVKSVAEIYPKYEKFGICISPEGTRKKVDKFRTGFYYVAKEANVPIIPCKFDWASKTVSYLAPFYVTDDAEADMKHIVSHFIGVQGKNYAFEMDI
jgi:1-acyl-sn-glycerol-3-phosphate acyltransferase